MGGRGVVGGATAEPWTEAVPVFSQQPGWGCCRAGREEGCPQGGDPGRGSPVWGRHPFGPLQRGEAGPSERARTGAGEEPGAGAAGRPCRPRERRGRPEGPSTGG